MEPPVTLQINPGIPPLTPVAEFAGEFIPTPKTTIRVFDVGLTPPRGGISATVMRRLYRVAKTATHARSTVAYPQSDPTAARDVRQQHRFGGHGLDAQPREEGIRITLSH